MHPIEAGLYRVRDSLIGSLILLLVFAATNGYFTGDLGIGNLMRGVAAAIVIVSAPAFGMWAARTYRARRTDGEA